MIQFGRVKVGLTVLAAGVAVGVAGMAIAETFDSSRFGDAPASTASTFDPGRFGDSSTSSGNLSQGTDHVTTGGIQPAATAQPLKDTIIVTRDENGKYTAETSVLGVDKTNTPEGKKAILDAANGAGEGMTMDELEGKVPATAKAELDAKSQKICNMDSASASKMAGDSSALQSKAAAIGAGDASAACMKALKQGLEACAKGDAAGYAKSMKDSEKDCPSVEPELAGAAVNTPTPVSTQAMQVVQNAGGALQQVVQQAQSTIGQMFGGNLMQGGGMQAILNMVSQQMVSQLMEKLTGGAGGSEKDISEKDYEKALAAAEAAEAAKANPTCDLVTATRDATKVEVVSAVTVTTVLKIDSCYNGRLRTRSTITMEHPNGTRDTKTSEAIQ